MYIERDRDRYRDIGRGPLRRVAPRRRRGGTPTQSRRGTHTHTQINIAR